MADNIFKRWTSKRGQEIADLGAPLSEIAEMLAQIEAAPMDRYELGSPASINKITWQEAGRLTEPGRYMFKFGWLTAHFRSVPTRSSAMRRRHVAALVFRLRSTCVLERTLKKKKERLGASQPPARDRFHNRLIFTLSQVG